MKLAEAVILGGGALYVEIGPLIFVWSGGPYIDIWTRDDEGDIHISDVCLNVWDYEKDESTIPYTISSLIDEATKWIDEVA